MPTHDDLEVDIPRERGRLIDGGTILTLAGEHVPTFHGCDVEYLHACGVDVGDFVSFEWVRGHRHAEGIERVDPTSEEREQLPMPDPHPPASRAGGPADARFESFLQNMAAKDRPDVTAEDSAAAYLGQLVAELERDQLLPPSERRYADPLGERPEDTACFNEHHAEAGLLIMRQDWQGAFRLMMRALQLRPRDARTLRRLDQLRNKIGSAR